MATIGTFTKTADGYTGTVKTLTLNVKATIKPAATDNDKAPDKHESARNPRPYRIRSEVCNECPHLRGADHSRDTRDHKKWSEHSSEHACAVLRLW